MTGAAAGLASAIAAQSGVFKGMSPTDIAKVSQLIGGAAALLAGGDGRDVNQGAATSQSAAINNYLTHAQLEVTKSLLDTIRRCSAIGTGVTCAAGELSSAIATLDLMVELSKKNDLDLINSCNAGASADCKQRVNDLIAFTSIGWGPGIGAVRVSLTADQAAVRRVSDLNGFFDWDTILANNYRKVLSGEWTPQQAFAASQQEASTKNGVAKVAVGTVALVGGALTCMSGVGTTACAIALSSNLALGTKDIAGGVSLLKTGNDYDVFVESMVAGGMSREKATQYAAYATNGLIAVAFTQGGYAVVRGAVGKVGAVDAAALDVNAINSELRTAQAGGACFTAGTPVLTPNGNVAIEDIRKGDLVITRDEQTNRTIVKPVVRTFIRQAPEIVVLDFETPDGRVETIRTTQEHPFHVEGTGFVPAKALMPGTLITTLASPDSKSSILHLVATSGEASPRVVRVKSTKVERGQTAVYNFEVADTHTYAVGKFAAWVHNICAMTNDSGKVTVIGTHREVQWASATGSESNHLAQVAAHKSVTNYSYSGGAAIELEGSTSIVGSQHYNFHLSLDNFWKPFAEAGTRPTVAQYTSAVETSLRNAGGLSENTISAAMNQLTKEQSSLGLTLTSQVPKVPGGPTIPGIW